MTDSYARSAEEQLNDSIKDAYVLAVTARQGRLNTRAADELAARLHAAADRMLEPADAALLLETASKFAAVTTRIKAQSGNGSLAKASNGSGSRSGSRPTPDYLRLSRAEDLERMASAGAPFSVNNFDADEARRAEVQNAQLRERQRRHEAQRRREAGE